MSSVDQAWGALGEGEELLWEGRARGRPSLRPTLPLAVMVFLFPYLFGALMLLTSLRDQGRTTWRWGWDRIHIDTSYDGGGTGHAQAAGPLFSLWFDVGGTQVPVPWLVVVGAGAAVLEVLRLARWRSQELALTTRRLLTAKGVLRRGRAAHARTGREALRHDGHATWLEGLAGDASVVLPGLDAADRQALEGVLPRFSEGPVPPPPRPLLDRRRLALVLLVLGLAGAVAWRQASGDGRVTAVFHRPGAPGDAIVSIEVDSPARSGLRVWPWEVDRDERVVGPSEAWAGSGGGRIPGTAVGERLGRAPVTFTRVDLDGRPWSPRPHAGSFEHGFENGWFRASYSVRFVERGATLAPERVHLAGVLHTLDGRALPFDLELGSPGRVEVDLSPR